LQSARARHEACVDRLRTIAGRVGDLEAENVRLRSTEESLRMSMRQLSKENERLKHEAEHLRCVLAVGSHQGVGRLRCGNASHQGAQQPRAEPLGQSACRGPVSLSTLAKASAGRATVLRQCGQ